MEKQNLYHVQDSDRPMWIVASSWTVALGKWKQLVAKENDQKPEDVAECQGIQLVCESDELLL